MKALLFLALLTASTAFAGLDRLSIQNLNFDYTKPYGRGEVDKIGITFSTKAMQGPYPVEIRRTDTDLVLTSPFVDINWSDPWGFIHDLEHLAVSKVGAQFGTKEHTAGLEHAKVTPKGMGEFSLSTLALKCSGASAARQIEDRIMDDCLEKLGLTISKLEVPLDFFMAQIVKDLPEQEPLAPEARPADNFSLNVVKGDFSMQVYTRVVFYAGLRAWGHVSQEEDHNVIVVRLDKVKFGYIPLTTIVLRELKKRLKHPNVTIDGNIIRIKIVNET